MSYEERLSNVTGNYIPAYEKLSEEIQKKLRDIQVLLAKKKSIWTVSDGHLSNVERAEKIITEALAISAITPANKAEITQLLGIIGMPKEQSKI
jgi:hypothetical protein